MVEPKTRTTLGSVAEGVASGGDETKREEFRRLVELRISPAPRSSGFVGAVAREWLVEP